MLTYLFLFAAFLFFPGWILVRLLAPRLTGYLTSFSASLALLMGNVVMFVHFRIPLAAFTPTVMTEIAVLAVCFGLVRNIRPEIEKILTQFETRRAFHLGAGLTVTTAAVYMAYAGIYTEVPADVWRHLGYIQWAYQSFDGSRSPLPVNLWYYIPAWFRHLAGGDAFAFIEGFGHANSLIQALGIYVFSYHIVRRATTGPRRAAVIAWLSAVFAAFGIGIDVFSYFRYYTFGPIFQGMLVYFCCALLVLEIFEHRRIRLDNIALLGVFGITMLAVHDQEVAFLYAFVLAVSAVVVIHRGVALIYSDPAPESGSRMDWYAAAAVLVSTCLLFLYTHYTFPIKGNVRPWIVPLSWLNPTSIHLYIANPAYQISSALTLWGVFVYGVFLLHWRTFRGSLFMVAGMLIPLATVFNPLFVDMFLRHSEAAPIYRFIYIIPLHIVAAWCVITCLTRVTGDAGFSGKSIAVVEAALLVVLLFPNGLPVLHNTDSRLASLALLPSGNDYSRWRDMLDFLGTLEATTVITDPVTAYMTRGVTPHRARGYKFHQAHVPLEASVGYYSRYSGSLLVINERNGAPSGNGRRAGHWPEDVLALSRHYPVIKETVNHHPERFELIWEQDRIRIYRITPVS